MEGELWARASKGQGAGRAALCLRGFGGEDATLEEGCPPLLVAAKGFASSLRLAVEWGSAAWIFLNAVTTPTIWPSGGFRIENPAHPILPPITTATHAAGTGR